MDELEFLKSVNNRYQSREEKQVLRFRLSETDKTYLIKNILDVQPYLRERFEDPLTKAEVENLCSLLNLKYHLDQLPTAAEKRARKRKIVNPD